ncbi:hypothetical protein [Bartonella sp. F02]|uniref:hypothetical protein n=1 Tax=Bartonella sp. F02 TaxID=2967262 RepID=UPI0022A9CB36|nr:hypothetical protein [Bartonella sp. F02]MCZ2328087.1 hypothetical protein [Bartonella sp. F02]
MNIKNIFTVYVVTLLSVSAAQGAAFVPIKEVTQNVSSVDSRLNRRDEGHVCQKEFSCPDKSASVNSPKIETVAFPGRKRPTLWGGGGSRSSRPRLSRGPMSF